MGKIIAIAVPKGGVGKSTTVINLAASLAIADKKVLIVDLDPMGTCGIALGLDQTNMKGGVFEIFNFTKSVNEVIHKTQIANLDFIPSRIDEFINEERLNRLADNKMMLRYVLRGLIYNYDFILIDCPPYLRGLTTCALLAADSIILPMQAESFSLIAVKRMLEHIQWIKKQGNSLLVIEGILLNMVEPRTKVSTIIMEELNKSHLSLLFKTVIPKNTTLPEATLHKTPAILYDATAKGSVAFLQLADELIQRQNHTSSQL
jgi:chromosome partitioning protein